jgi:hypothetical protein
MLYFHGHKAEEQKGELMETLRKSLINQLEHIITQEDRTEHTEPFSKSATNSPDR